MPAPFSVVVNPQALARTGPPHFSPTGECIPDFTCVRELEHCQDRYARVAGLDGRAYGWTDSSNLATFCKDLERVGPDALPASEPITIAPAWPALRRALAATYNRIGGLLRRLAIEMLPAVAAEAGIASALAVWYVESGGRGHTPGGAIIRFENHKFAEAWGNANADARALYDAYFEHGGRNGVPGRPWQHHRFRPSKDEPMRPCHTDQSVEYEALETALGLAPEGIALRCLSIGGPQIVIANHRLLGYATPESMYRAFQGGEETHVLGFFDFCQYRNGFGSARRGALLRDLENRDWNAFARRYNGPGQAAEYGERLRRAFLDASALLSASA
ncbi:MAG TPA: N-acetylmuramidase domain-containing protein [Candidatus Hydrogenedentes bacterium]|nr:N-acetylmuramidase domain-containing protein [Candidatus Hydrogenedentota bacterium]